MTIFTTNEDLSQHPQTIGNAADIKNSMLAIGDLHGNAMKAIYFLIRYGVMTLENEADYETLHNIYTISTQKKLKT